MTGTSVYSSQYLMQDRKIPAETIARAIQKLDTESCPSYDFDIKEAIEEVQNPHAKFFFLVDDDTFKIVGYMDIISLEEKYHKKVLDGTFKDGELEGSPIPTGGNANLYIRGFVIAPSHRHNSGNFKLMVKSLMEWVFTIPREYSAQVVSVTARGLTDNGKHLCRAFGMVEVRPHKDKGLIYQFLWNQPSMIQPPSRYGKKCKEELKQKVRS